MHDADEPALPAGEGGLSRAADGSGPAGSAGSTGSAVAPADGPLGRAARHGVPEGLARVRLDVAYDGTAYAGWARQIGRPSVQGVIEDALGVLARADPPRLTVAGRTDAGVHARGQVAHVDLSPKALRVGKTPASGAVSGSDPDPGGEIDALLLRRKLNGLLPLDVRVRRVSAAPPGFDARFSAVARTYRYLVADRPETVDPLRRSEVYVVPRPLDLEALQAACPLMLGEHDFAAYCRRREGATTVRGLLALDWTRDAAGLLVMTIEADAFCHSMVRSIVGAMLAVGEGRRPPDWPASLLTLSARANDVAVAPSHGLVLETVTYPPDDQLLARQGITRNLRA